MNTQQSREVRLGHFFVRLADNLVNDFDIIDHLNDLVSSSLDLFDLAGAGLMLADPNGQLRVMAASSEEARVLELFELQNRQGPCLDSYQAGAAVSAVADTEQTQRWPLVAEHFRQLGYGPVYAFPMRLRDQTIGALNLFRTPESPLSDDDLTIAQAMSDAATISVLQHRAAEAHGRLAAQLQTALNSRIAIEQAKGVIAQYADVDMDQAFAILRRHARNTNQGLSDLAAGIASGRLQPGLLVGHEPPAHR